MRALLVAVVVMGVLIIVGTTVLVVAIFERLGGKSPSEAPIALQEPAGTKLVNASSDGSTLTLILATASGNQIEVRDAATGQLQRRFVLSPSN